MQYGLAGASDLGYDDRLSNSYWKPSVAVLVRLGIGQHADGERGTETLTWATIRMVDSAKSEREA
jgi:hypothetical protein